MEEWKNGRIVYVHPPFHSHSSFPLFHHSIIPTFQPFAVISSTPGDCPNAEGDNLKSGSAPPALPRMKEMGVDRRHSFPDFRLRLPVRKTALFQISSMFF
jgi:hypothetical protein